MPVAGIWRRLDAAERPALAWIQRHRCGGTIDRGAHRLTRAGEHGLIWYCLALFGAGADGPRRRYWLSAGRSVARSYLYNTAIKYVAQRRRPPQSAIQTATLLSFPSSHAATSFAAARMMSSLVPAPAAVLIYALATAVTATRAHFCAHYPSDLVAGALMGDRTGRATVRRWQRNQ